MALKIFWTETAVRQRNMIFEYWNERNGSASYSLKLFAKIKERANILKENPEIGKNTDYKNMRAVSLGHYSIFYQYDTSRIIITAFWDNRQEPKKLLESLKKG